MKFKKHINLVFVFSSLVATSGLSSAQDLANKENTISVNAQNIIDAEQAEKAALDRYTDGEELIFSVILADHVLGEVYTIYQSGQFYFHFEEFIQSANFPISQDVESSGFAYKGWWAKTDNIFNLSFDSTNPNSVGTVNSAAYRSDLKPTDYIELFSEVFVSQKALSTWFGVEFDYNLTRQRVILNTSEAWPIQQSLLRKGRNPAFRTTKEDAKEPLYDPGYKALSPQMLDAIASVNRLGVGEDDAKTTYNYGITGRNDLLGWSSRYFVGGNNLENVSQAYLNFSKHWSDKSTAPLGISSMQFGDIQPVAIRGRSVNESTGISVTNKALRSEFNQDTTNISGYVQEGWDIELFHNNVLIANQQNVVDGRFEFLDVLLFNGKNTFEIKKYGPQGQVESEIIEKFSQVIAEDLFSPTYEISLLDNNNSVAGVNNASGQDYLSLDGRYSIALSERLGLNAMHSFVLEDTQANTNDVSDVNNFGQNSFIATENTNVVGAGLSYRPFNNLAFRANLSHVEDKFNVFDISAFTSVLDQKIVARASITNSIEEGTDGFDAIRISVSALGSIGRFGMLNLRQGTTYDYVSDVLNNETHALRNNISANIGRFTLSNNLFLQRSKQFDEEDFTDFRGGTLGLSGSFGSVFTRAGINYNFDDTAEIDSAFASANFAFANSLLLRAKLSKDFSTDLTQYSLGLDYKHNLYAINTRLDYDTERGANVYLSGRISIGEAPTEFGYFQNRNSLTNSGTVLVRVFHDVNNNGLYDYDDIPLENVKVFANQMSISRKSDPIGIVQFDNLASFKQTDISIDADSLDNPFLVQSTESTSTQTRPGLLTLINYPMVEGAEIEGEVWTVTKNNDKELVANLPLALVDQHGTVRHRFKSGFDGYFYVPSILPHQYQLIIDPESNNNPYLLQQALEVDIEKQGEVISGLTIEVIERPLKTTYFAYSGKFSSKLMLESYLLTISHELLAAKATFSPFVHLLETGDYSLGIYYSEDRASVSELCERLSNVLLDCSIDSKRYFADL